MCPSVRPVKDTHFIIILYAVFFSIQNNKFYYEFIYLQKDGEIDLRMLIHQSLAGCVIGKAGSKIKELREVRRLLFSF